MGYLLFGPDLLPKLITHSVVVLYPVVNGNFVKGFHTSGTDLDVPAKKHIISRVSLGATRPLTHHGEAETQSSASEQQEPNHLNQQRAESKILYFENTPW